VDDLPHIRPLRRGLRVRVNSPLLDFATAAERLVGALLRHHDGSTRTILAVHRDTATVEWRDHQTEATQLVDFDTAKLWTDGATVVHRLQ